MNFVQILEKSYRILLYLDKSREVPFLLLIGSLHWLYLCATNHI